MQLKSLLSALIVLPMFVSAEDRYVLQTKPGVTKRSPLTLEMQPLHLAKKAVTISKFEARALLKKRQGTCPTNYKLCSASSTDCCQTGTYCVTIGGVKGCCPDGKTCNSVSNCPTTQVDCKTYCCPSGSTCAVGANGQGTCNAGTDNGECGVKGYSPCTNMQGCCPTGVTCVPPNKCDVKCTASDPKCGDGCCLKGSRCTAQLTCVLDDGSGDLTSISVTRTSTVVTTIRTGTTTTSRSTIRTTGTLDANAESSTDLFDETSTTSRRVPTTTSTQTVLPGGNGNAAATAGVDSLLGLAAGLVGYLAL